jgi:hypothetical protein
MSATEHEIRQAIDEPTVRSLQIVQLGLTAGVVLFAGVVWFRAHFLADPAAAESTIGEPLIVKLAIGAIVAFLGIQRIADFVVRRRIAGAKGQGVPALLEAARTAFIVRLALLEAPALFGIALCFLASPNGPPRNPMVWLGLLPAGLFVVLSAMSFPNRERLAALVAE